MGVRDGLEAGLPEVGPLGGDHCLQSGPVAMGLKAERFKAVKNVNPLIRNQQLDYTDIHVHLASFIAILVASDAIVATISRIFPGGQL